MKYRFHCWWTVKTWLKMSARKNESVLNWSLCHPFPSPSVFCPSIRTDNFRHISTSCSLYKTMASSAALHVRARSTQYPGSTVARFPVPDDKVDWSVKWAEYKPVSYTAPTVLENPEWADPDIGWAAVCTFWNGDLLVYTETSGCFLALQLLFSKIQCIRRCCG